jgi:hypothetical protein
MTGWLVRVRFLCDEHSSEVYVREKMRLAIRSSIMRVLRFLLSASIGLSFFALPIRDGDRFTLPFDWLVQRVLRWFPGAVGAYCLLLILLGASASLAVWRGAQSGF